MQNAQPRSERQPSPEAWSDAMQPAKTDAITPHFGDPSSPPSYHVRTLAAHVELAAAPAF